MTLLAGFEHVFEPAEGTSPWTVLLLHGTGGDEHDLVPLGRQLAPGTALLSPRGRVLEGGLTNRFFARRAANDVDVDDLRARTTELVGFVSAAIDAYALDPEHVLALGYSNGANVALNALLEQPGALRAAALLRPVLYHVPDELPDLTGTQVLTASGAHDPYSPPEAIARLAEVLERTGASVQVNVDQHAGHGLVQDDLRVVADWMARTIAQ
jgi:predicted esterase